MSPHFSARTYMLQALGFMRHQVEHRVEPAHAIGGVLGGMAHHGAGLGAELLHCLLVAVGNFYRAGPYTPHPWAGPDSLSPQKTLATLATVQFFIQGLPTAGVRA